MVIYRDGVNATISGVEDTEFTGGAPEDVGVIYDSLAFAGNVQTPTTGPGGAITEDYDSISTSPSTLSVFQFVGGVETAGHVVFFLYFDNTNTFVDGFGVQLPSAGFTFIWTITIGDPTSIDVPDNGFLTLQADDGTNNPGGVPTNAAWRFKDVAPAIGTTAGDVYRMTMTVIPEPASLALLAVGGLLALRRR
jgi:hypothetical protein